MAAIEKKERIIKAAARLFTRRRFHEITLDEVAQAAKVGKGTIYLYFEDKDDLFFQTATAGFDDLCALVRRHARARGPFAERLARMCREVAEFFEERREIFAFIQAESAWIPAGKGKVFVRWLERRHELETAIAAILEEGVDEGAVRADVPAATLAMYLMGMLRTRFHDLAGAPASQRSFDLLVELFCNGAAKPVREVKPSMAKRAGSLAAVSNR
jgi:AcrR family transcriptional regulator